jgi:hypothetical protein
MTPAGRDWLRLPGHNQPRHHARDTRAEQKASLGLRVRAHLPFAKSETHASTGPVRAGHPLVADALVRSGTVRMIALEECDPGVGARSAARPAEFGRIPGCQPGTGDDGAQNPTCELPAEATVAILAEQNV